MELSPNIQWIRVEATGSFHPSALDYFEQKAGVSLHAVAKRHLLHGSNFSDDPFPRLEAHNGYLFGQLSIPSSVDDDIATFDDLVIVSTHLHSLVVIRESPTSESAWEKINFDEGLFRQQLNSAPSSGWFIAGLFQIAVDQLHQDVESVSGRIGTILTNLGIHSQSGEDEEREDVTISRKRHQSLLSVADDYRIELAGIQREIPGISRVSLETERLLDLISSDQIDLVGTDSDPERQLFDRDIEIYIKDIYFNSRHVNSMLLELQQQVGVITERLKQLRALEQVKANRVTGAITSIMLLPTFIVGLYGQNFEDMPESQWQYGYLFSWGTIVIVTSLQIWFFKKRKWI